VPRVDHEDSQYGEDEDDSWTPTYRSQSLLQLRPSDQHPPGVGAPTTRSSAPAKTFADMARRFHPNDIEGSTEHSPQGSMPGIIKLQPRGKIGQNSWRPLQTSELGVACENASSSAENLERLLHVNNFDPPSFPITSSQVLRYNHSSAPHGASPEFEYPDLATGRAEILQRPGPSTSSGLTDEQRNAQLGVSDQYAELFGRLPDQIWLQEQLGEFDGQVVFVGHPNRNISAHQWSTAAFQWESIGRYAHSRDKVEGSLASDRVKDIDPSHNALLHFKCAAEEREKLITQTARLTETTELAQSGVTNSLRSGGTPRDPVLPNEDIHDKLQGMLMSSQSYTETPTPTPTPSYDVVKKEDLDDPFVARRDSVQAKDPARAGLRNMLVDVKGSLDLRYEFPVKEATPSRVMNLVIVEDTVQKRDEPAASSHGSGLVPPSLREIGFGEEACNGFAFSVRQSTFLQREPTLSALETVGSQQKSIEHELLNVPLRNGAPIPRFQGSRPTARSLFPDMGLTIANPYRVIPRTNVTAQPVPGASSKALDLGSTNVDRTITTALQFSDPDVLRQAQEYEITNGLSQQAPTPQNFKGPFFTDSKPTANDPTASLSIHISEEEKLRNWFRDGHRPARQREYARTLVSAAAAGSKNRYLGAIGDAAGPIENSQTKNTTPFVRLYEGLSEYIEEYRNGSGGSYFTRSWKVAATQLRDLSLEGNNSFFSGVGTTPASQYTIKKQQEGQSQGLNGLGHPDTTEAFYPYGTVGDKGASFGNVGSRWSSGRGDH
jgi:hypothetical protein